MGMEIEDIERLEARIHQLIDQHAKVKKEKEAAEKRLQQTESEFHQLRGQIRQFERERNEIREKLGKILGDLNRLDLG
jgi:predicted  nucleic acid-binding Zn-ribbon protein